MTAAQWHLVCRSVWLILAFNSVGHICNLDTFLHKTKLFEIKCFHAINGSMPTNKCISVVDIFYILVWFAGYCFFIGKLFLTTVHIRSLEKGETHYLIFTTRSIHPSGVSDELALLLVSKTITFSVAQCVCVCVDAFSQRYPKLNKTISKHIILRSRNLLSHSAQTHTIKTRTPYTHTRTT